MLRSILKSKIHRATVTDADLHYEGSITIDSILLDASNIIPNEKVHVWNVNNGHRFQTYALRGVAGSGTICINGAAAHLATKGDLVIISSFALMDDDEIKQHDPKIVFVNEKNEWVKK